VCAYRHSSFRAIFHGCLYIYICMYITYTYTYTLSTSPSPSPHRKCGGSSCVHTDILVTYQAPRAMKRRSLRSSPSEKRPIIALAHQKRPSIAHQKRPSIAHHCTSKQTPNSAVVSWYSTSMYTSIVYYACMPCPLV
jgi:hypothetical protein